MTNYWYLPVVLSNYFQILDFFFFLYNGCRILDDKTYGIFAKSSLIFSGVLSQNLIKFLRCPHESHQHMTYIFQHNSAQAFRTKRRNKTKTNSIHE
jgi:hypothetical protein